MKLSIIIPIIEPTEITLYSLNSAIDFFVKNCEKEIILVSDTQFKPETFNCYKELKDNNWKFIINKKPIGIFESRRKGLKKSTGDLIWFLDSTDNVSFVNLTENMLDYDVSLFNLSYFKENNRSVFSTYNYNNFGNIEDQDYKKLNPFATRHIIKKYLNPFIDNFIFKADYIKSIYEKFNTINNFNKFSNLYLITAALKYMKSFKYYNSIICTIKMKNKYCNDRFNIDKNEKATFGAVLVNEFFNEEDIEEFKTILEKDEANVSKEILAFLDSFKSE
jgi:hypothetical protein